MMDYRKKLNEMKEPDLEEIAQKLKVQKNLIKIPGGVGLTREAELIETILKCPEKEIKKALVMGLWQRYWKPFTIAAGIASILAVFLALFFYIESKKETSELKDNIKDVRHIIDLKINDPEAVQKFKEEYEKKLAETEETIENLKGVDIKVRDEALKAFREGDYSKADKLFADLDEKAKKRQEEVNRERSKIVIYRGDIAYLELDFEGALAHYSEAQRLDPKNHEAWASKGIALYFLKKYKEAISAYDEAIELKPDNFKAYNNKGAALGKLCKYEAALAAYDKAIAIKPDFHEAWSGKGAVLNLSGKYEAALAAYDKAIAIKPDDASAYYNKGIALRKLFRYKESEQASAQAEELKKD